MLPDLQGEERIEGVERCLIDKERSEDRETCCWTETRLPASAEDLIQLQSRGALEDLQDSMALLTDNQEST